MHVDKPVPFLCHGPTSQKFEHSWPVDGTSVYLPLDCKSLAQPLVEDLFTNHANGNGNPPALVPSVGLFNIS